MHGKANGPVAEQDQEVLTRVHESYDVRNHGASLRLPAEFVDRYAIVGAPEECIRRIGEVAEWGLRGWWCMARQWMQSTGTRSWRQT